MIAISSLTPSLSCGSLRPRLSHQQTHHKNPIFCPKPSSGPLQSALIRNRTAVLRSNSNDPKESAAFMDEDGAVDDMDGYMNYLSLEYDSVWDTKPSWCQPWTITLTGVVAIASSWLIVHSALITTVVVSLICAWWYIFLYTYPKAYSDMIAERRKKVTDGLEDTFGLRNTQ